MSDLGSWLEEQEISTLSADGFDEACIGYVRRCGQPEILVYDIERCVDVLVGEGLSREEAEEFLEFNSIGAWVGDSTPGWLVRRPT